MRNEDILAAAAFYLSRWPVDPADPVAHQTPGLQGAAGDRVRGRQVGAVAAAGTDIDGGGGAMVRRCTHNIGIVTGYGGVVVLDFDEMPAYEMWQDWAKAKGGAAAAMSVQGYKVRTARGVHVYLRCAEVVTGYHVPGIGDVKAADSYVLAPPSVHPSGHIYQAANDWAPIIEVAHLADVFPFGPRRSAPTVAQQPRAPRPTTGAPVGSIIQRIRACYTCADLLGVDMGGRRQMAIRCPLHDDHAPSMILYANDGKCRCLAGCEGGKQLDVVDLYAAMYGVTIRQAAAQLAAQLHL